VILLRLISRFPYRWRSALGALLGSIFGFLPLREQRVARGQIRKFLGVPHPRSIARGVFSHIGRLAAESLNLHPALQSGVCDIYSDSADLVRELSEDRKPVLALTAHFGNWELMAAYIAEIGFEIVTVGREIRHAGLQQFIEESRSQLGIRTIWRGGLSGQRQLIQEMKNGKVVAALIDQDTRVHGQDSQFFGHYVTTPSSMIDLALRYNARIVTAFNYRLESGRYIIEIEEVKEERETQAIIDTYNSRLENIIQRYPEQWVWFHKRWRTLPDGKRLSSSEYMELLAHA